MIKALAAAALIFTAAAPAMADPNVDYGCGLATFCGNDLNAFKQKISHDVCGNGRNGAEAIQAAIMLTGVTGKIYEAEQYGNGERAGEELFAAATETIAVASARGRCRHSSTLQFLREVAAAG